MILSLLLKYWREAAIVILIVAVAILAKSCHGTKQEVGLLQHAQDSAYHYAKEVTLKNGQQSFQINTYEATVKQLRENGTLLGFKIDSLVGHAGRLNNLVAYWQGKATMKGAAVVTLHDTLYLDMMGRRIKSKEFEWNNKYLFVTGLIAPEEESISLTYKYDVDFSLVAYRGKKPISEYFKFNFKKPPIVTNVTFSDQNMKVGKFEGVVAKEEPTKWYESKLAIFAYGLITGRLSKKK